MVVRECIVCGKNFEGHNSSKMCSDKCRLKRKRVYNNRHREYNKKYYSSRRPQKQTKTCVLCNKKFVTRHKNKKYCGKECSDEMQRCYQILHDALVKSLRTEEILKKVRKNIFCELTGMSREHYLEVKKFMLEGK